MTIIWSIYSLALPSADLSKRSASKKKNVQLVQEVDHENPRASASSTSSLSLARSLWVKVKDKSIKLCIVSYCYTIIIISTHDNVRQIHLF